MVSNFGVMLVIYESLQRGEITFFQTLQDCLSSNVISEVDIEQKKDIKNFNINIIKTETRLDLPQYLSRDLLASTVGVISLTLLYQWGEGQGTRCPQPVRLDILNCD